MVRATPSVEFGGVSVLSDRLARGRAEKGWSQERTASEVGAAKSTWSDWERGDVRPRPEKLRKIGETLGIPHDELTELFVLSSEEPAATPLSLEARVERLEREMAGLKREHHQALSLLKDVMRLRNALAHAPNQAPAATGQ